MVFGVFEQAFNCQTIDTKLRIIMQFIFTVRHGFDSCPSYVLLSAEVVFQKL